MKTGEKFFVVLVTAPDLKTARKLARVVLRERKAACVNLVRGIESHYWWEGKMEEGKEVLLIIKTSRKHLTALEKLILEHHPYDTPEFIALLIHEGNRRYLSWISGATT